MLRYTSGTFALAQCPSDTAHESESARFDRSDLSGQSVAPAHQDWRANQTTPDHVQTENYGLLSRLQNTVESVHHSFHPQNRPPLGHAPASSCLHGTSRCESHHESATPTRATRPQGHYAQSARFFCALTEYVTFPAATARADHAASMRHRVTALLATFVHGFYLLLASWLGLAMAQPSNPDPESLESPHACYGLKSAQCHADRVTH